MKTIGAKPNPCISVTATNTVTDSPGYTETQGPSAQHLDMSIETTAIWGLSIVLGLFIFLFIFRIILTWYPQVDLNSFPVTLATWPTEPLLIPTRKLIPPMGGVDITPIIWVGITSLLREILIGQQGLLRMLF